MLSAEENRILTDTNPGTPMGELFRRFWLPILTSEELPAPDCTPVRVRILGEDLVAFRDTMGEIGIVDAFCAHRRAPLFFGRNEECGLRCIYHGWKYDVHGNCVDMPSEPPESTFKERIHLKAYKGKDSGGVIWAYMGPPEKEPPLPDLEWRLVSDSHRYMVRYEVDSNYMQAMEGDDDSSHVSFLHSQLKGTIDDQSIGNDLKYGNYWISGKSPRLFVENTNYGLLTGAQRPAGEGKYYWRITPWLMPIYSIIPAEPGMPVLCNVRVPVDNEHSLHFRIVYHPERPLTSRELDRYQHEGDFFAELIPGTHKMKANKENDYLIDRYIQRQYSFSGIKSIPAQDRAMSDGMGPIVDRSKEHLGTSDTTIIQMRRQLLRAAKALSEGKEPYMATHPEVYHVRSAAVVLPREVSFQEGAKQFLECQLWESQASGEAK